MSGRDTDDTRALLSPRKLVIQVIGFVIGMGLLLWCIALAFEGDGWHRLTTAPPGLVVGLAACSLVSVVVNGVIFWLVIRPVHPLKLWDLQCLNFGVALLNYAPIRLGLIARVAYHLRVDRMSLLVVGGWLAAIAYTLALALGACILATVVRPIFDLAWAGLVAGQILLGGALTWAVMGQTIVVRYGRGMDRMLRRPSSLFGALGLRLVDIAAFVGRMACAAAILDLALTASDVLLLGFAALAMSLSPLGRTGFREAAVAFVAARLAGANAGHDQVQANMALLAIVESAGEAIVFVPGGAIAMFWYRKRWKTRNAAVETEASDVVG